MMKPEIGIAIPAYKSVTRLKRCLESIERVNKCLLEATTVVDDSGDGSVASVLASCYPQVNWIENQSNTGFACAANTAVRECASKWVLLLNDDVELVEDFSTYLLPMLDDNKLFAVAFRSIDEHGAFREGAKRLAWRFGIARIIHNPSDQNWTGVGVAMTAYAVGGHAVFNREIFTQLNGFDAYFAPFYWEDVDLSIRAANTGHRIIYLESCKVMHRQDGAIKSSSSSAQIRYYTWRSRIRFSLRHARGIHRILLPIGVSWHFLQSIVAGDFARTRAIASCLYSSSRG